MFMKLSIHRLILLPIALVIGLSACVSNRQWSATGGDKQAGVVRVSYQYPEFHQPDVSDAQAIQLAENRCASWGYKHADPVAGLLRECSNSDKGNCNLWTVTREFQCRNDDASYAVRLSR